MKKAGAGLALLAASCITLEGCGGGSSNPTPIPSSTPTPAGSFRTVIVQGSFALNAGTASFYPLDGLVAGTVEATVDWSNAANNIKAYLTTNDCVSIVDLRANRCQVLARAETVGTKPKRLSASTGTNTKLFLWVENGGSSPDNGSLEAALLTSTPYTAPTPAPPGTDPRANLASGPVYTARIKIRTVDQGNFDYRPIFENPDGTWTLYVGEFVVFDFTQKNQAGQECQWVRDPEWFINDQVVAEGATDSRGVLRRRGSSQPFLLRTDVVGEGTIRIQGTIDGVFSNFIDIRAERQ
jgi:hypothetical protein